MIAEVQKYKSPEDIFPESGFYMFGFYKGKFFVVKPGVLQVLNYDRWDTHKTERPDLMLDYLGFDFRQINWAEIKEK